MPKALLTTTPFSPVGTGNLSQRQVFALRKALVYPMRIQKQFSLPSGTVNTRGEVCST